MIWNNGEIDIISDLCIGRSTLVVLGLLAPRTSSRGSPNLNTSNLTKPTNLTSPQQCQANGIDHTRILPYSKGPSRFLLHSSRPTSRKVGTHSRVSLRS